MPISLYHLKDRNTSYFVFPHLNRTAVIAFPKLKFWESLIMENLDNLQPVQKPIA
jgi:hypothetical protein